MHQYKLFSKMKFIHEKRKNAACDVEFDEYNKVVLVEKEKKKMY